MTLDNWKENFEYEHTSQLHFSDKTLYVCDEDGVAPKADDITDFIERVLDVQQEEIVDTIKTYFAHIMHDGVTGRQLNLSYAEILNDIINLIKRKD